MPASGGFVTLFVTKDSIYDVSFVAWPSVEALSLSHGKYATQQAVFQLKAGSVDFADRMTFMLLALAPILI